MKSWTNSLDVALRFSDPNRGLVGKMNLMQRRMIRRGLKEAVITNHGVVLVTVAPGIPAEQLAVNKSENEFWLTGEDEVLDIQVTQDSEEIRAMLNSLTPKLSQRDVERLSRSNKWVAQIKFVPQSDFKDRNLDCGIAEEAKVIKTLKWSKLERRILKPP